MKSYVSFFDSELFPGLLAGVEVDDDGCTITVKHNIVSIYVIVAVSERVNILNAASNIAQHLTPVNLGTIDHDTVLESFVYF